MSCEFPAWQLLRVRRGLAALADESCHLEVVRECARLIQAIDQMRWSHYDRMHCPCWQEAHEDRSEAGEERML